MYNSSTQHAGFAELASTSLVTFFLHTVPSIHSVELLGSWDNFSTAYPMAKDSRRGRGHWRGIHSFKNIICDGDPAQQSPKRDGALLAGGLYWYFYRLNGDLESHNPSESSTTSCPLLPGQRVNILDVPTELSAASSSDHDILGLLQTMTLNPEDRWAPLKRRRVEQAPTTSACRRAAAARQEYLQKDLGRQSTAAGEAAILTSSGYAPPLADNHGAWRRPRSAADIFLRHVSVKASSGPTSSHGLESMGSQNFAETRSGALLERSESIYSSRPAHTRRKLQNPVSFFRTNESKRFPFSDRAPPSRARTAMASFSTNDSTSHIQQPIFGGMFGQRMTIKRPRSSPNLNNRSASNATANDEPNVPKIEGRMKSLRLRIACAKLKTMQMELSPSPRAGTWSPSENPKNFSDVLRNYQTSDDEQQPKLRSKERASVADELSQSPPQLSFCSRESTIWTPDSGSVKTGSGLWGSPLQSSFRYSLESALTVYNDEDDQSCSKEDGGNREALGVQFSSLGLGSQETIKPARTIPVDPEPLDSDWNPFCDPANVEKKLTQSPELLAAQTTHAGNELMSDLAFLGAAIA